MSIPPANGLTPEFEDQLAAEAITIVMDMREDLRDAHLRLWQMDRLRLVQVCCVLAAMVQDDLNMSKVAWWRPLEQEAA